MDGEWEIVNDWRFQREQPEQPLKGPAKTKATFQSLNHVVQESPPMASRHSFEILWT